MPKEDSAMKRVGIRFQLFISLSCMHRAVIQYIRPVFISNDCCALTEIKIPPICTDQPPSTIRDSYGRESCGEIVRLFRYNCIADRVIPFTGKLYKWPWRESEILVEWPRAHETSFACTYGKRFLRAHMNRADWLDSQSGFAKMRGLPASGGQLAIAFRLIIIAVIILSHRHRAPIYTYLHIHLGSTRNTRHAHRYYFFARPTCKLLKILYDVTAIARL